jgi:hypothetical protein|tara:strand:+ start:523 stop:738 length:216 start_codon:yes stop_codon:yes gene_type:complete
MYTSINLDELPNQHRLTTKQQGLVMELIARQNCLDKMKLTESTNKKTIISDKKIKEITENDTKFFRYLTTL